MTCKMTSTSVWKGGVTVRWADGTEYRFHNIWLRDNCPCESCGDHASGARFQSLLEIAYDVDLRTVEIDDDTLFIVWKDGHSTYHKGRWLKAYAYDRSQPTDPDRNICEWNSSLSPLPAVDFQAALQDSSQRRDLYSRVSKYGFVIVRNLGVDPASTRALTSMLGYVRDTNFGLVSDLQPRTNGQLLSDFSTSILPHSDETYRNTPIGINIFHCIEPSDDGGGVSYLVDSHRCARLLKETNETAFSLLRTMPIAHERRVSDEIIRSQHPAISLDPWGRIAEVRLNERTMTGINVPFDTMEAVYSALRLFFEIAYADESRVEYSLQKGEALVFDNLRILHGRSAFSSKNRHLRQTNVMRDEFYARLAYLNELLSDDGRKELVPSAEKLIENIQ